MTELELKKQFASFMLKTPDNPFQAALAVLPEDTPTALRMATEWERDPDVLRFMGELSEGVDEEDFLPTKAEFCRKLWSKMHPTEGYVDVEDYTKLGKLYADTRGFIEKPQTKIDVNTTNVSNKVMVIREAPTSDVWEAKLLKQQTRLLDESNG